MALTVGVCMEAMWVLRYVALLWALSTAHNVFGHCIGSTSIVSPIDSTIAFHEDCLFQVLESELRCKIYGRPKFMYVYLFMLSILDHVGY